MTTEGRRKAQNRRRAARRARAAVYMPVAPKSDNTDDTNTDRTINNTNTKD